MAIFHNFAPFLAAMGSNIHKFHLFHASWSEITHRKNHRKYFFMKINIFGIFGQKSSFRGPGTVPFSAKWVSQVQILVFVKSIENFFWPKLLIEKIQEKEFFMKIDIFGIFWPKTEKMGHAWKWVSFQFCPFFWSNQKV